MNYFHLLSLALLGRILLLMVTAGFYPVFILVTAKFSKDALKCSIQVLLPLIAVISKQWFGFTPTIALWILYILIALPIREDLELKVMGIVTFGLSLIPVSIILEMLSAI